MYPSSLTYRRNIDHNGASGASAGRPENVLDKSGPWLLRQCQATATRYCSGSVWGVFGGILHSDCHEVARR